MLVVILAVLALSAVAVVFILASAHKSPITELDLQLARIDEEIIAARGTFSVPQPRRSQAQAQIKSA